MKSLFCLQQERVVAAIQSGQWPERCDPKLRVHPENCEACREAAVVAQLLLESRNTTLQKPQLSQLPSAGLLWWRAQIRRRNAAIARMTRPIAIAETVAFLVVLLAAVALVAWQYQPMAAWLSSVLGPFSALTQAPGLLALGAGSLLIFGGFALYLLRAKE